MSQGFHSVSSPQTLPEGGQKGPSVPSSLEETEAHWSENEMQRGHTLYLHMTISRKSMTKLSDHFFYLRSRNKKWGQWGRLNINLKNGERKVLDMLGSGCPPNFVKLSFPDYRASPMEISKFDHWNLDINVGGRCRSLHVVVLNLSRATSPC